ncbi:glycosyltransferase family 4 protein [Chlorogloeopsis sp. ULAP02]|uniref:glycosyltransferase family 4 protein n=1 Tax=Chlorogloeopsis sp. ULAP02 TaxID=3107926 RepID=UPI003136D557
MFYPRIIYLNQYFTVPTVAGGSRAWEFCTRLVRDGCHVNVICGNSEIKNISQTKIIDFYKSYKGKLEVYILSLNYSNNLNYYQRILVFISFAFRSSLKILAKPKADITFATSTPLTIAIPALLRKLLRGTPYVFEVRDLWPEMPIAVKALRSPVAIFLARQLERIAYQNAAHIIALSPGMKEGIIKQGIPAEKIEVIPNACDNERFNIPDSVGLQFLSKHPELSGGPLIIYTGTLGYINGVTYLAYLASYMMELIPEAKFLVVGSGAYENEVREVSRKLGIFEKNFWMWSPIPKDEMPALLSACTVATSLFLPIPEMENNSANKFFDALAASRPVVINYGGWQKEILEQYSAGISIPGNDAKTGAKQLANFLNKPEDIYKARLAARQLADTIFDRELLYKKLAKVFHKVLNQTQINLETSVKV